MSSTTIVDKYVNDYNYIRNKILMKQNRPLEFVKPFSADYDNNSLFNDKNNATFIFCECKVEDQEVIYTDEFIPVITNEGVKYSKCYTFDGNAERYIVITNSDMIMYCDFQFSVGEGVHVMKIINKEISSNEIHKFCLTFSLIPSINKIKK